MSIQYFLSVAGIGGASTNADYHGFFDVAGFNFDESAAVSTSSTGGVSVSRPDFGPLEISFSNETGLTGFLNALSQGSTLAGASLVGVRETPTGAAQEVYRINLAHVLVTDVTETSGGGYVVSLDYGQVGVTTHDINPDGTVGAASSFNYDVMAAKLTSAIPNTPGAQPELAVHPTTFFAAINGLDGGSTDTAHRGWFELSNFNLNAVTPVAIGGSTGGMGTGKPSFDPITLHLPTQAALTDLLGDISHGATISDIRIEGMSPSAGGLSQAVYDLDLGGVHVTGVTQSNSGGLDVTLAYTEVKLVTTAPDAAGGAPQTSSFAWNIATDSPNTSFSSATPGAALSGGHPSNFYLSVAGVAGPATAAGHQGAFGVESFSFGTSASVTSGATGTAVESAPHYGPLQVTLADATGLATFLTDLASGSALSGASLVGETNGPNGGLEVYRVNLAEVIVTGVTTNADGSSVVTLDYGQIGVTTHSQNADGSLGSATTFAYDVAAQKALAIPPPDVTSGGAATVHPTHFYAAIDGMNGGATDPAHTGWFQLDGFNLNAMTPTVIGSTGGLGAGKPSFDPITLHLGSQAALTQLMTKIASGGAISDIRIEGLSTTGTGALQPVYDLDLGGVHITGVAQSDSGGLDVTLAYSDIQLAEGPNLASQPATSTFAWDIPTDSGHASFTTPHPSSALTGDHPDAFYLSVAGVSGSSTDAAYKGFFNVGSFNFATDATSTISGGVTTASKPDFGPLQVTLHDQTGLAAFLTDLSSGAALSGASLVGVHTGPNGDQETYRVNLAEVMVTGVSATADGGYEVTLDYGQIGVTTTPLEITGALGASSTFAYDVVGQKVLGSPPPDVAGGAGAMPVHPTSFFAAIDGLDGGSTAVGHQGWFQLDSFGLDAINQAVMGATSGMGAGKPSFDPITLHLPTDASLTQLMTLMSRGASIDDVRIEGMSSVAGGAAKAVYDLDLANVHITDVAQSSGGGLDVTLAYTAIRLTTEGETASGGLVQTSTFSWDIAADKPGGSFPTPHPVVGSDTTPPSAPTGLADPSIVGGYVNAAHEAASQLTGAAEAGSTVALYDNGGTTALATATADSSGHFAFDLSTLGDGAHSLTVTATDAAGNVSAASSALSFTVDTQAPAAPTGLADLSIVNGYVNGASEAASQLAGTAEAGSTVALYDNGGTTALATATADSSGHFTFNLSTLADGAHNLTVTATDAAGNVGAASSALGFTVDTQAPAAPTGLADVSIVNGYVNAAHEAASQLAGTAEAGSIVSLYDNGGTTALATATADSSGRFSFDLSTLADGAHSLTVAATDAAGNVGAPSSALAFTVDTQAPAAPTGLADLSIVNGYVNAAHEAASQLTGAAEAGSIVSLYDNGGTTALATATADSSGHFTFDLSGLADAAYSLTVTATDAAGNVGAASSALDFTVDTQPPAPPTALADLSIVNGYVNAAHEAASQLTGTAEAGSTVALYDNGGMTALATTTADSSGHFTFDLSGLADAAYSLTVTATDAAGNVGAASAPLAFTVDTHVAAPGVALVDDSGVTGDGITNDPALALSGIETGATVEYSVDGGQTWTQAFTAAEGPNAVEVRQTDLAGNVSTPTDFSFTLDTHPPAAPDALSLDPTTDSGIPFDRITNHGQVLIDGKAEAGSTVTLYDTDGHTVLGSGVADAQGAFHITTSTLADGQHEIFATATDVAGNTGAVSAGLNVTIDTTPPVPEVQDVVEHGGTILSGSSEPLSAVFVYDAGRLVGLSVTDLHGDWSVDVHATGNEVHDYTVKAVDLAGNVGTSPGETLYTPAAHEHLVGGPGDDVLIARPNDTLTGGGGNDTFVFNAHFGKVTVTDFAAGDRLAFDHSVFSSYADVMAHARQVGGEVVISEGHGDVVTLQGLSIGSLNDGSFLFI